MSPELEKITANFEKGNVLFKFTGQITPEIIEKLLSEIEIIIEKENTTSRLRKKIFNILVEGLQNLYHHTEELPNDMSDAFPKKISTLYLYKENESFSISMGNFVDEASKDNLTERIKKINTASEDQLKELYMSVLDNQKMSEKGGGGLGLIDIARKSQSKLVYNFYSFDNNWYFYNLTVNLS